MIVRYLTHPQVAIDPTVAVEHWGLNAVGRGRLESFKSAEALRKTRSIVSSAETKAIETAQPIADALGIELIIRERMHENDRTATGYLPPDEFEAVADQFFAKPDHSIRGWERAVDAQTRIVAETMSALDHAPDGDVLLVGHGGVGTLLMCHLAHRPIDRSNDQTGGGGGNVFGFERRSYMLRHGWQPMEMLNDPQRANLK